MCRFCHFCIYADFFQNFLKHKNIIFDFFLNEITRAIHQISVLCNHTNFVCVRHKFFIAVFLRLDFGPWLAPIMAIQYIIDTLSIYRSRIRIDVLH